MKSLILIVAIAFILIAGMILSLLIFINNDNTNAYVIIITLLFIIFIISIIIITKKLILNPLQLLIDSLHSAKNGRKEEIYGTNRHDEIGLLSNTIHDLFIKGNHDGLTGIYNRHYLEQTLNQLMTALSRADTFLSVMMIDVDFFKKYNDSYGHTQGDECLKTVAKTINKNIIRTLDFTARYGGDEFLVILPSTDEAGTRIMADKMLNAIRELKMPHRENTNGIVTISIGVASGNINTQDYEKYIKKADEALYISKNNGRNCCTFLSAEN